jgi:Flp pilus assembly pilin Flp
MRDRCSAAFGWFCEDEEAASLVEYILIVSLIALVCVLSVAYLGFRARRGFALVGRAIQRGN